MAVNVYEMLYASIDNSFVVSCLLCLCVEPSTLFVMEPFSRFSLEVDVEDAHVNGG